MDNDCCPVLNLLLIDCVRLIDSLIFMSGHLYLFIHSRELFERKSIESTQLNNRFVRIAYAVCVAGERTVGRIMSCRQSLLSNRQKKYFKIKLTVLISRIRKSDCIRIAGQSVPLDNEFVVRAPQCIQINLKFGRE